MGNIYPDDEIEISFEEFDRMVHGEDEYEINIDEFIREHEDLDLYDPQEQMDKAECEDFRNKMHSLIEKESYQGAYVHARVLKSLNYSSYRSEIDDCIELCAKNGVLEALVDEAQKYTRSNTGLPDAKAYVYLERLAEAGYIQSFRYLADCCFYGIGCDRDKARAMELYLKGILFTRDEHCLTQYRELQFENSKYHADTDVNEVLKTIIEDRYNDEFARIRLAEIILDGRIKEFESDAAYVILKNIEYWRTWPDAPENLLGECLLRGWGVEKNPFVALRTLEASLNELEDVEYWYSIHGEDALKEETFHDWAWYRNEIERTALLIEEAKEAVDKLENDCGYFMGHDIMDEPELIYSEWEESDPQWIKKDSRNKLISPETWLEISWYREENYG